MFNLNGLNIKKTKFYALKLSLNKKNQTKMNLFLLSFISLCLCSVAYTQTCEVPKETINVNGCKFYASVTNPIRECTSASCPPCKNDFSRAVVSAAGSWQIKSGSVKDWDAEDPKSLMIFDQNSCLYILEVRGLEKSAPYEWKVPIHNSFKENYGCDGSNDRNCKFTTSSEGSIRLEFNPSSKQLSTSMLTDGCKACTSNDIKNPHEECYSQEYCPAQCDNNLADNLLHVSGDWLVNANFGNNWDPSVEAAKMNYDYQDCQYSLKVRGLKSRGNYTWKVSLKTKKS